VVSDQWPVVNKPPHSDDPLVFYRLLTTVLT
jgi:hypothetical protein